LKLYAFVPESWTRSFPKAAHAKGPTPVVANKPEEKQSINEATAGMDLQRLCERYEKAHDCFSEARRICIESKSNASQENVLILETELHMTYVLCLQEFVSQNLLVRDMQKRVLKL